MAQTFGPPPCTGDSKWLLIHSNGSEKVVEAHTCFEACARAGWAMSEVITARPYGMPPELVVVKS
jgi:hypothetical protein